MTEKITELDLLDTEVGRFFLELRSGFNDINLLIDASTVPQEIKEKYKVILKELLDSLESEKDVNSSTVHHSRYSIIQLLGIINKKDSEQYHLFETVRNAILRAENSALGFSSEYMTK